MKNIIVGESGGPTAVINSSVAGVYKKAKELGINKVYGMVYGIEGFLKENIIDLDDYLSNEENYELLKAKMDKLGLTEGLEWYLDTRKYGGCVHSGFGIGFDRLLMYVTGMQNIRDVQPYPRTSNTIKY